jgi:hypothetical protein
MAEQLGFERMVDVIEQMPQIWPLSTAFRRRYALESGCSHEDHVPR